MKLQVIGFVKVQNIGIKWLYEFPNANPEITRTFGLIRTSLICLFVVVFCQNKQEF